LKNETQRHLKRVVLSSLVLLAALCAPARAEGEGKRKTAERTIEGMVYFTNNAPDVHDFLVELFDSNRRRVAARQTEPSGHFEFKGLRPGKYYLQVSIGPRCLLQYEVDARAKQPESLRVFGDADCGRSKITGIPKPRPVPRDKKR
jgi:hypothetical protein